MSKGYSILYTDFNDDFTFVHYCSDGYCRKGYQESSQLDKYLPKWVHYDGIEYSHAKELPNNIRKHIIDNYVNYNSSLHNYWLYWLEKSSVLYEKDKFLQDFYNCTDYDNEYEFDKTVSSFNKDTRVSDKIQEITDKLRKKMQTKSTIFSDKILETNLSLKINIGEESFEQPIELEIKFDKDLEKYVLTNKEDIVFEPTEVIDTTDYKKEFEGLLEEFDILEDNYDTLKDDYMKLKENLYSEALLNTQLTADYEKLEKENNILKDKINKLENIAKEAFYKTILI